MERTTPVVIADHPDYLYTSRAGLGSVQYVFRGDRVFTSLADAIDYVTGAESVTTKRTRQDAP